MAMYTCTKFKLIWGSSDFGPNLSKKMRMIRIPEK